MIFETNRLRVRKLNVLDIDAFHEMQRNINVMQFITGKVTDYKGSLERLKSFIDRYETKKMEWPLAIDLKSTGKLVGICGIIEKNEIGYRFLEKYWRQGFGAEILDGLIIYARNLGLENLMADVLIENKGSFKLLERAGFTIIKEQLCPLTNNPEFVMELKLNL